ncbi:hypothetical protein BC835DRAFT_571446 [Cytidiella melzeri]|nr:hypothetical protein BC835DRAFT_571446 [Cytidiella melzeri]
MPKLFLQLTLTLQPFPSTLQPPLLLLVMQFSILLVLFSAMHIVTGASYPTVNWSATGPAIGEPGPSNIRNPFWSNALVLSVEDKSALIQLYFGDHPKFITLLQEFERAYQNDRTVLVDNAERIAMYKWVSETRRHRDVAIQLGDLNAAGWFAGVKARLYR